MSKLIQALFTGMLVTFILDFFMFLGIKQNYIEFYEIGLYYNILFADNQNIYIFSFLSIIFGIIVIYINHSKITLFVLASSSMLVLLTLLHPIGYALGEALFMKRGVTLRNDKHIFRGNIYYEGREKITFFDTDINKIILLNKKELVK